MAAKPREPAGPKAPKFLGDYGRYASVGLQFGATMGVFGVGGYYADQWLGTYPWLMILGIFLGATGGFIQLVLITSPKRGRRAGPS